MQALYAKSGLERVIGRTADGSKFVDGGESRVRIVEVLVRLVGVAQTHEPGSLAADVSNFERSVLRQLLLHIQIEVLNIGRGKTARGGKNVKGTGGDRSQDRRSRVGSVEGSG